MAESERRLADHPFTPRSGTRDERTGQYTRCSWRYGLPDQCELPYESHGTIDMSATPYPPTVTNDERELKGLAIDAWKRDSDEVIDAAINACGDNDEYGNISPVAEVCYKLGYVAALAALAAPNPALGDAAMKAAWVRWSGQAPTAIPSRDFRKGWESCHATSNQTLEALDRLNRAGRDLLTAQRTTIGELEALDTFESALTAAQAILARFLYD